MPPLTCCSMRSDQVQGGQSDLLLRQDGPPPDSCSQFCCCLRSGAPESPEDFSIHLPPSDKHPTGKGCHQHLSISAIFQQSYCKLLCRRIACQSGVSGTAGILAVIQAHSASYSCKAHSLVFCWRWRGAGQLWCALGRCAGNRYRLSVVYQRVELRVLGHHAPDVLSGQTLANVRAHRAVPCQSPVGIIWLPGGCI